MAWSMPYGDIANLYALSFNPIRWASGSAIRSAACARTARTGSDGEVRHEAIDGSSLGGERDSGGVRDGR